MRAGTPAGPLTNAMDGKAGTRPAHLPLLVRTERTLLRPFTSADAEAAFSWLGDAEVMRFIPSGADQGIENTSERIERYVAHGERHGFTKWMVIEQASGCAIGDAGFFFMPDGARVELGYRLARSRWGLGLASEVAAKWLELAHPWYQLETVFAYCHPDHAASRRVLEKLGFEFIGYEAIHGWRAPVFSRKVT
jgi:ribosomal-protein-alanine N-acetyltransferase